MANPTKPPLFLPFEGTCNDLFLEIADKLKSQTPEEDKTLFWEVGVLKNAQKITTNLLFEAVTLAFFEKHKIEIMRHGDDSDEGTGFFDFRFPAMTEPNTVFEYVGGEGTFMCFSNDNHHLPLKNLKKDPTVKKYLTTPEQNDLLAYLECLTDLSVKRAGTIVPVAMHLEKKTKGMSPMKKKYPGFYPLLESRMLSGQLPTKKKTATKKM